MTFPTASATGAYSANIANGVLGQIADSTPHSVRSYVTSSDMSFGIGVVQGTADNKCKIPVSGSTAALFLGVTVSSFAHANSQLAGALGIPNKDLADVMTKGCIFVTAEASCAPGDAVYLRVVANGAGTAPGQFTNTADSSNTVLLSNCAWRSTAAAASLAILEINAPSKDIKL